MAEFTENPPEVEAIYNHLFSERDWKRASRLELTRGQVIKLIAHVITSIDPHAKVVISPSLISFYLDTIEKGHHLSFVAAMHKRAG